MDRHRTPRYLLVVIAVCDDRAPPGRPARARPTGRNLFVRTSLLPSTRYRAGAVLTAGPGRHQACWSSTQEHHNDTHRSCPLGRVWQAVDSTARPLGSPGQPSMNRRVRDLALPAGCRKVASGRSRGCHTLAHPASSSNPCGWLSWRSARPARAWSFKLTRLSGRPGKAEVHSTEVRLTSDNTRRWSASHRVVERGFVH